MDDIGAMLARHTISGVDGWRSSLSFLGGATPELSKIAWDLHQVLRRRLAWDRAVAEGLVASADAPRRCPEMMQVSYDDAPLRASSQPLATLAKAACEADETLAMQLAQQYTQAAARAGGVQVSHVLASPRARPCPACKCSPRRPPPLSTGEPRARGRRAR
jgi:hypothetical protein